jgi:iron(III) transport system substrate-binding protein
VRRHSLRIPATFALLSLALTACGESAAQNEDEASGNPVVEAATYDGDDRQEFLEKCAADEGTLQFYTAQNEDLWQPLTARFQEMYPDLSMETTRRTSGETAEAIVTEGEAGQSKVDVIEVKDMVMNDLRDYLTSYTSPEFDAYPEEAFGEDNKYVTADRIPYGLTYNTTLVAPDEVPESFEDLLDPRWKGQMALTTTLLGTQYIGLVEHLHGEEGVAQLGAQEIRTQAVSSDAITSMVAAGEAAISPSVSLAGVDDLKADGAPVEWVPVDTHWTDGAIGISAEAKNPCTGMLFIDFVLSEEGQTINPSYLSAREDVPENEALSGLEPVTVWEIVGDDREYSEAYEQWTELINQNIIG